MAAYVVWDWNGTLFDDVALCIQVMNGMLEKRGLPRLAGPKQYRQVFTFPVEEYYKALGFDFSREPFSQLPAQECWRRILQLCQTAREMLAGQRRDGVSLLCDKALEDINRNYMDETLSLSIVSERLHVSPNYLSANMKKYAGDTFINLLIKKRMEVAEELLKTTNLKILEVAKKCGYSDQHYFSYCFKKYFGVSPVGLRRSEGRSGT